MRYKLNKAQNNDRARDRRETTAARQFTTSPLQTLQTHCTVNAERDLVLPLNFRQCPDYLESPLSNLKSLLLL